MSWSVIDAFRIDGYNEVFGKYNEITGGIIDDEWTRQTSEKIADVIRNCGYIVRCNFYNDANYIITYISDYYDNIIYGFDENDSCIDSSNLFLSSESTISNQFKHICYSNISNTPSYDESDNDSEEEELENQIKMRILNNRLTEYFITIGNSLPADIVNALKKYRDDDEYFKLCSDQESNN